MKPHKAKLRRKRAPDIKHRRWMDLARARTLALENIENDPMGEPNYDSHVVRSVHRLWKKPIGEFTTEELRLMIGQSLGLPWLVPLALERLDKDPFTQGDFYPGDLFSSLLGTLDQYLELDGRCLGEIVSIARRARAMIAESAETWEWNPGQYERPLHESVPRSLVRALDELIATHGGASNRGTEAGAT